MNIREARKLKQGAIVREAWHCASKVQGIVLSKQHVHEEHTAKLLCQKKSERYNVKVHWLGPERTIPRETWGEDVGTRVQVRENWELMVVSHG